VGLLENNPWIHSLMAVESTSLARLITENFDLVLNPEAAKKCSDCFGGEGKREKGFGLSPEGYVLSL